MKIILRDYQIEAVNNIRNTFQSGYKAPILCLPTGSGKTVIFCDIAEKTASRGKRVYIIVHRKELLDQTSRHLDKIGIDHGIIAPNHAITGEKVQIASVYTMSRRLGKLPHPDFLIIDEAHHTIAKTWKNIVDYYSDSYIAGFTATPQRLDGKGLGISSGGYFDKLISGPSVRDLINTGYLSDYVAYRPPTDIDMEGIKTIAGDYDKKELSQRINKPKITGSAVQHYIDICNGLPAIAFCTTIKHAENVSEEFNKAGVSSLSIDGKLTDDQRRYRINALASGQIRVLTSCELISEGTDIPVVSVAILLRPTKSLSIHLQQLGRVLRPYPGKKHSIILDHVNNCIGQGHGFPDTEREWSLEGRKKKKKNLPEDKLDRKTCKNCYAMFPLYLNRCPQCGFEYMTKERKIEQVAGNLVEVKKTDIDNYRKIQRMEVGKAETLEELIAIGERRGYNPQWAYIRWQIKQGRKKYA